MAFDPVRAPQDYVILAGQRSPGICDVLGAARVYTWNERRGYGIAGASLAYVGRPLARFTLKIRLYSEQDWQDWARFSTLLRGPERVATVRRPRSTNTSTSSGLGGSAGVATTAPSVATVGAGIGGGATASAGQRAAALEPAREIALRVNFGAMDIEHPILGDLGIRSCVVESTLQPLQTGDGEWTVEVRLIEHLPPQVVGARVTEGSRTNENISPNDALIESLAGQAQELLGG